MTRALNHLVIFKSSIFNSFGTKRFESQCCEAYCLPRKDRKTWTRCPFYCLLWSASVYSKLWLNQKSSEMKECTLKFYYKPFTTHDCLLTGLRFNTFAAASDSWILSLGAAWLIAQILVKYNSNMQKCLSCVT